MAQAEQPDLLQFRNLLQRAETLRISLLFAHGGFAILLGALLLQAPPGAFAGNTWHWLETLPGGVLTLGCAFTFGGLFTTWGVLSRESRVQGRGRFCVGRWLQLYGLALIGLSDLTFAIGFTYAHYAPPAEPGPRPPLYPLAVYSHVALVMLLHFLAVRVWQRQGASVQAFATASTVPIVMHIEPDALGREHSQALIAATQHLGHQATTGPDPRKKD